MVKLNSLNKYGIGMIVLLIVQYLLGMFTNLFVQFPEGAHEGQLWEFAWSQFPLASHIIVGVLLLIGSIVLIIRAIKQKNSAWIIASIIGFLGILISGLDGAIFITAQSGIYSYIMSIFFLVAFISYGWGVFVSIKHYKS